MIRPVRAGPCPHKANFESAERDALFRVPPPPKGGQPEIALCGSPRGLEGPFRSGSWPVSRRFNIAAALRVKKRTYDDRLALVNRRFWQVFSTSECDPTRKSRKNIMAPKDHHSRENIRN